MSLATLCAGLSHRRQCAAPKALTWFMTDVRLSKWPSPDVTQHACHDAKVWKTLDR